jgi:hypothetical protein
MEHPVTRANLIERLQRLLEDAPQLTSLSGAATSSSSTVTVADATHISTDTRLEVGTEIMRVAGVSGTTITVDRGYMGTTGAAHDSGVQVRINPRYVRANLVEALNVVLNNWISTYIPQLRWDTSTAGKFVPTRAIYPAPADAIDIVKVGYKQPGFQQVVYVEHGPLAPYPTSIVSTGVGVEIFPPFPSGYDVWLHYERPWPLLTSDADTVETDFPPQADDLIVTGAALYLTGWRLVPRTSLSEITFARERQERAPSSFNVSLGERLRRDWMEGIQRVAFQRPHTGAAPGKVWRS